MTLVLISDFMQDEIYLSEEIKFYGKFDRVIFYNVKGHQYSNKRLEFNDHVEIGKLDIFYKSKIDRLLNLAKGFFRFKSINELIYLFKSKKISFNSIKQLMLFIAKSNLVYENISENLKNKNLGKDDKIVFYTYRLGFSSLATIKLKEVYSDSVVVSRCHGQDIFEFRNKENYLPFRKNIYENIYEVVCISDDGRNYLKNRYPLLESKLKLYRLGTRNIHINENLGNEEFTIITCSRIARIKRLDVLAKALTKISDYKVHWIHYGDGEQAYLTEIQEILKERGKNIEVSFMGFFDNEKYLEELSKKHYSVFVNISESEGLPVSIMEAESVGLPIIATDVGGTSESLTNKYNGFLLDKDFETDELIKIISHIKNMDINEYKVLSENSRKMWEENFDMAKNYEKFTEHLKKIYGVEYENTK